MSRDFQDKMSYFDKYFTVAVVVPSLAERASASYIDSSAPVGAGPFCSIGSCWPAVERLASFESRR